jgi:hypothetical protein
MKVSTAKGRRTVATGSFAVENASTKIEDIAMSGRKKCLLNLLVKAILLGEGNTTI